MLDRELERRGYRFVRDADDFSIYVKSRRAGERVMESVTRLVEENLRLKVNREKSRVESIYRVELLGFSFGKRQGKERCRPTRVAKEKFKRRLKELTSRNQPGDFLYIIQKLNRYLAGWINYYGIGRMVSFLRQKQGWLHHRLRQLCCIRAPYIRCGERVKKLPLLDYLDLSSQHISSR